MTGTRTEPTPEDLEIFGRTVKRLMSWTITENFRRVAAVGAPAIIRGPELAQITRRAIEDGLHFSPSGSDARSPAYPSGREQDGVLGSPGTDSSTAPGDCPP